MALFWYTTMYVSALVGPLGAIFFLWEVAGKNRKLLWTAGPCAAMFAYGWVAFMAQGLGSGGALPELGPRWEWPVLSTEGAVVDTLGRSYVPHATAGRIQVYDSSGAFLYGWFVPAGGGSFRLHVAKDGRLDVYVARSSAHLVYAGDGQLLTESRFPEGTYGEVPTGPPSDIEVSAPLYLWPFGSPFLAWLVIGNALVGMLIHRLMIESDVPATRAPHVTRTP